MVELPPNNGRQLYKGDPLCKAIDDNRKEYAARGESYPSRRVDDYHQFPHVWYNRAAYDERDLVRLYPTYELQHRPVILPDHFIITGHERLPGESKSNYEQYLAYRDLGSGRTIKALGKALGKTAYHMSAPASRWRWEERAAAWDAQIEIEARRAAQSILETQLKEEVEHRALYLKNEWEVVERGFGVVHEMLKYPVVEQESRKVSADGKTIVTVWKPGKWTYAAMAALIEALTKVGRLNTGLSTSNASQRIDATVRDSRMVDADAMTGDEAEMHAYASRKAEDAYFAAMEEWKAAGGRPAPPSMLTASIAMPVEAQIGDNG